MELALEAGRLSTLECEQRITAATEWSQLEDVRQRQLADLPLPHTSISRNRLARRRFLMALGACCVAGTISSLLAAAITLKINDQGAGLRCDHDSRRWI